MLEVIPVARTLLLHHLEYFTRLVITAPLKKHKCICCLMDFFPTASIESLGTIETNPEERKLPRRCSLVCPHQTAWYFQARFLPSSSGGSLGAVIRACIVRGRGLWNARQQREGEGPHLALAFVSWVIEYSHHLLTFPGRCKLVSVPLNSLLASS